MDSVTNTRMQQDTASLERELAELKIQNAKAASWAGTVAARDERIREIETALRRQALRVENTSAFFTVDAVEAARDAHLANKRPAPKVQAIADLVAKLNSAVTYLETVETLPRPYDLYYPIKNDFPNTGWRYHVAGVTVSDLREVADALAYAEAMRPHWAMGFTSDSIAAQTATAALNQLWKLLGVGHQTAAVEKLQALIDYKAEAERAAELAEDLAGPATFTAVHVENTSTFAAVGAGSAAKPAACVICGLPLEGVQIGAGDGTGQRFAREACYHRRRAEAFEKALKISHEQTERLYALLDARNKAEDAAEPVDPKSLRYAAWLAWIGCQDHPFARARFAEIEANRPWLAKGWDRVVAAVRR